MIQLRRFIAIDKNRAENNMPDVVHPDFINRQDAEIELAELEKHEEAIKIFDEVLQKHRDNINIIYAKARSKAALDQLPESLELSRKAVSREGKTIREWAKKEKIFEKLYDNEEFKRLVKF